MLRRFKHYFGFTKKELNGILVLCFLLLFVFLVPYVLPLFEEHTRQQDMVLAAEAGVFMEAKKVSGGGKSEPSARETSEIKKIEYFRFDPNLATLSDWTKLGLTDKQALVIEHYRAKGGQFRKPEDLKKIYSISPRLYEALEPYIYISSGSKKEEHPIKQAAGYPSRTKVQTDIVVDLNTADSSLLETLRGIGPVLASRIIRYRDRLGGFHSSEQLLEVYGIDSARYSGLEKQIAVGSAQVRLININTASFDDLKSNPYLSFKQMNAIIRYRKQHGPFSSLDDLRKIAILNEEILRKIAPYLSF